MEHVAPRSTRRLAIFTDRKDRLELATYPVKEIPSFSDCRIPRVCHLQISLVVMSLPSQICFPHTFSTEKVFVLSLLFPTGQVIFPSALATSLPGKFSFLVCCTEGGQKSVQTGSRMVSLPIFYRSFNSRQLLWLSDPRGQRSRVGPLTACRRASLKYLLPDVCDRNHLTPSDARAAIPNESRMPLSAHTLSGFFHFQDNFSGSHDAVKEIPG